MELVYCNTSSPKGLAPFVLVCLPICPQKKKSAVNTTAKRSDAVSTKNDDIVVNLTKMRRKRKSKGPNASDDENEAKAKQARVERNLRVLRAASNPTTDLPVFEMAAKLQSRA